MTTIHIHFGSNRKPYNPKPGDLRMRKGVLQIRVFRRTSSGAYVVSSSRQCYDWEDVAREDLPKQMAKYEEQQKKMSKYVYHVVYQNAGLHGCSHVLRNLPIDSVEAMDDVLRALKHEIGLALEEQLVITNLILLRGPEAPAVPSYQRQFAEMCQLWGPVEEYARKNLKVPLGESISAFVLERLKELDRIEGEAFAKLEEVFKRADELERGEDDE